MISLTKLLFPPLRALPEPVGEFHDFRPIFPFSRLRAMISLTKLLFPPLRALPEPVGEFHDFRPTFPFSRYGP